MISSIFFFRSMPSNCNDNLSSASLMTCSTKSALPDILSSESSRSPCLRAEITCDQPPKRAYQSSADQFRTIPLIHACMNIFTIGLLSLIFTVPKPAQDIFPILPFMLSPACYHTMAIPWISIKLR